VSGPVKPPVFESPPLCPECLARVRYSRYLWEELPDGSDRSSETLECMNGHRWVVFLVESEQE
jgi:hypothetical protein